MDIMKTLVDQFGGQIIEGLAGNLGLGAKEAESSLTGALPAILGGLINKVGSDSGATEIFDVVKKDDGGILDNIAGAFSGSSLLSTGLTLLPMLLGGQSKMGMVADLAGRLLGVGGTKSRSVLGMLAPLVIGFLGRQVKSKSMGKQGLVDMLLGQKDHVKKAAHPEMASLLGFSNWGGGQTRSAESHSSGARREETRSETVETTHRHVEEEKGGGGMGFLKFLIPLLLLGALAWFLMRSCGGGGTTTTTDANKNKVTGADKKKAQTEQTTKRNNQTKTNTNATTRSGTQAGQAGTAAGGTAAGKVDSKVGSVTGGDAGAKVDGKAGGGNFTGKAGELANGKSGTVVNFGTVSNGKVLTSEAKAVFDQVAAVMKANPNMKIDIRAHSKDHGNAVENTSARAACKFRAGLVQAYLKLKGVALNRVKSSSIGKKEPMSGVDPKDDKQKRIEIKIQ